MQIKKLRTTSDPNWLNKRYRDISENDHFLKKSNNLTNFLLYIIKVITNSGIW